jgi:serine/threonine protein phosphatase 1
MAERIIAIGDIHGCAAALRAVIDAIRPQPRDTLIPLGDVIDRGPDSRGAVEQLLNLREKCRLIPLLGNHEEMMLAYVDGRPLPDDWLFFGGKETLLSYDALENPRAIPAEHLDYMRTWGDYWETDSHFFVHGNYDPELTLSQQPYRVYRWVSLRESVPGPHLSGRTAIVGHTSQKDGEILDLGYLQCIDSYCHGGGWLTALDVTTGHVWQADRHGRMRNSE